MSSMTSSETDAAEGRLWDLCIYVTDKTPRSVNAVTSLKRICEEHLPGRYRIEIVDLLAHPERAATDQIIAVPTVVRRRPAPVRTSIGDLSDARRVLAALNFREARTCIES
jgi:circadian clock protein KaiB